MQPLLFCAWLNILPAIWVGVAFLGVGGVVILGVMENGVSLAAAVNVYSIYKQNMDSKEKTVIPQGMRY